tara:strand:- start:281 stop:556 length:276 start_codon:yes stop_codon:yes gene_type:complete
MNVAIDIQTRIITKMMEREFCSVVCRFSLNRDGAIYPHINPATKAMVRQVEPTIAKPTLTGILLNAPNTTETMVEATLERKENRDEIAFLN